MYGKHFQSMYTGSMHGAGADIFCVWGYAISHVQNGVVELNPVHLAPVLGMTIEEVAAAIEWLCKPDPNSRSETHDGCRLLPVSRYAFEMPTHGHYRDLRTAENRREYMRDYMSKRRKAKSKR